MNEEQLKQAFLAGKEYYHRLITDQTKITTNEAFKLWIQSLTKTTSNAYATQKTKRTARNSGKRNPGGNK